MKRVALGFSLRDVPTLSPCLAVAIYAVLETGFRAMSNRARDKAIREGVKALRRKAGWDPRALQKASPADQLRELEQSESTRGSYRKAAACEACQAARQKTGDDTALCPEHFAEAMGL